MENVLYFFASAGFTILIGLFIYGIYRFIKYILYLINTIKIVESLEDDIDTLNNAVGLLSTKYWNIKSDFENSKCTINRKLVKYSKDINELKKYLKELEEEREDLLNYDN